MSESKFCYKCGAEDPEYTVCEYRRKCEECQGLSVLTTTEMIDIINDMSIKGHLVDQSDFIDEEFSEPELDLDSQDIFDRAERDALGDYLEDMGE